MKTAVVSVTNDLSTDQRVQRSIAVLRELGFAVTFVGRRLPDSQDFEPGYTTRRFRLWFTRGFAFYAAFNLRLFFYLLRRPFDLYLSNDLDTLWPNFWVARWRGKPLVYDSHEYFTGVPEIQHRPLVKWVWTRLERALFPRLKHCITVNDSIAELYQRDYGMRPLVVRNIADSFLPPPLGRAALGLPQKAYILINQGSGINVDRGMEEMLRALHQLSPEVILVLVGKGDVLPSLKQQAQREGLQERVIFVPPQPYGQMLQYTLAADCGLSLDKDSNINYRFSLPNKVFDYIKCGLPMVVSPVVEVRRLVEHYGLGEVSDHAHLAAAVERVRRRGKSHYRAALARAAAENNWEHERQKLIELFARVTLETGRW